MGKDDSREMPDHAAVPPWSDSHEQWNVGMHWFRGSFPKEYHDRLVAYLLSVFGPCDSSHAGFWRYDEQLKWPNGVRVFYHSSVDRASLTAGRNAVEISGEVIQTMKPAGWIDMMLALVRTYAVRPSRVDVFFDDHERIITPIELLEHVFRVEMMAGKAVVTVADWTGLEQIRPDIRSNLFEIVSASVTFGRRGSAGGGRCQRIYDKALESKGENNAVRWEVEHSDEQAREVVDFILDRWVADGQGDAGLRSVAHYLGAIVAGSMDFRRRSLKPNEKNVSRLPRFGWWTKILHRLQGELTFHGQRLGKSIIAAREYVDRQVTATLQMLSKAFGSARFEFWLRGLLRAEGRLRKEHLHAIEEYRTAVDLGLVCQPATPPPGPPHQTALW